MNKEADKKYKLPEQAKENPFSVPEGYFNSFADRLQERVREGEQESGRVGERESERVGDSKFRIMPHLALAAAISGFALISFTVIKLILGPGSIEGSYDIAFLDEAGILNESAFQETIAESEEYGDNTYTDWEVDAMEYLASNEVYLEALLSEN